MDTPAIVDVASKRGAEDSGRYFRYMADFVGFMAEDAETIRQTRPVIEKHLPEIVGKFYAHLLRYPPTRKVFLKKDGTVDQDYVELRMRHLTNFWLRTANGSYDDDYARYVDYVGRAHTSHGADPHIYIAERYVIGQVGFVQHAISVALQQELSQADPGFCDQAEEAWDKLLMVILEMLSRAYGNERETENFDALVPIDEAVVSRLAAGAFAQEHGAARPGARKDVLVALAADIPEGERKIVQVGDASIGIFHHNGAWYAIQNHCLHRGGPVATGCLEGDVITCPWHGFQYNVTNGELLVDPSAKLGMYPVTIQNGEVHLQVPETTMAPADAPAAPRSPTLQANEFMAADLAPGQARLVHVGGVEVAVFNVSGTFYATQNACTHFGGPLNEGELVGCIVECPLHGSRFDVSTGQVARGPAVNPVKTYQVTMSGGIARVS